MAELPGGEATLGSLPAQEAIVFFDPHSGHRLKPSSANHHYCAQLNQTQRIFGFVPPCVGLGASNFRDVSIGHLETRSAERGASSSQPVPSSAEGPLGRWDGRS